MSNELAKFLGSRRRHKTDVAISRQVKIAKEFGIPVKETHKFAKHHAMNCGNPNCVMCGNPRKTFKELTQQEKRLFQDTEKITYKHSNGLKPTED